MDLSLVIKGTEAAEEISSQSEAEHASRGASAGVEIGGILGGLVGSQSWLFLRLTRLSPLAG